MSEKKPLYESPGAIGRRGLEDLVYVNEQGFDLHYKLIRQAEQSLNGFMAYVRRQRAGSHDYGNKSIGDEPIDYAISSLEAKSD